MTTLYLLLACLLVICLSAASIPFIRNKKSFGLVALTISVFVMGIYYINTPFANINAWLQSGASHYALMQEFEDLGGVDGAIKRIEARLAVNPNDETGKALLQKLLLLKKK